MTVNDRVMKSNQLLAEYNGPTKFYEFEEGMLVENTRLESINQYFGVLNSRQYSRTLNNTGMSMQYIIALQHTRFNNGEGDIVGREIIWQFNISPLIVEDMMYRLLQCNNGQFGDKKITFKIDKGDEFEVRFTDTGKRTYHGKKDNGEVKIKDTTPKQYRRNRRVSW